MNKQIKENEEIIEKKSKECKNQKLSEAIRWPNKSNRSKLQNKKSRKFLWIAKSQIFFRGLMQKNIPKKQKITT